MADKSFYQAAAAEVAAGHLDPALWIKVNADLPEAKDVVKQAKYIQLRAEEIARDAQREKTKTVIKMSVTNIKRRVIKIVIWGIGISVIGMLIANLVFEYREITYAYRTIKSGPELYKINTDGLASAKSDRDFYYNQVLKLGRNFEYSDGSTSGDRLDWANGRINGNESSAREIGTQIQNSCRYLPKERLSFIGGIIDPMVREPSVDPICSLWLSDNAPIRNLPW